MKYLSFWWMFQPNTRGSDDALAQARDREQLGEALQQAEHDGLAIRDRSGQDQHGCPLGQLHAQAQ